MLQRLGDVRVAYLDQLRAIAIATVVISHYDSDWLPAGGAVGVGIFFALSGFLIASLLLEEEHLDLGVAARFVLRRFMRIYPAYLIAVLTTVMLTYFYAPEKWNPVILAVPGILTFMREEHSIGTAFRALWTLQIEMAFYLTVPIAMLVFGKMRGLIAVSIGMAALSMFFLSGRQVMSPVEIYSGDLAFGALVAAAWKSRLLARLKLPSWFLVGVSLLGIVLLLFQPDYSGLLFSAQIMAASLCGCGLVAAFLLNPALFVAPGLPWLGRISYSIYLVHGIVLDFRIAPELIWERFYSLGHSRAFTDGMTFVVVVIGLSALSYRWIERPGMRAGKRLASALFRSRQALPSAG